MLMPWREVISPRHHPEFPMTTAEQIADELEAFYKSYIAAFNREDIDAFTESFAFPYAWITGSHGLSQCATESDHQSSFGKIMTDVKARGWVRSGVDRLRTWALAEDLAMILADVTRFKADGSVLEQVRACYTVRRDAKGWKIVTLSEVKRPFLGPGDLAR
jgi:ketosteroid isomerase-like protein